MKANEAHRKSSHRHNIYFVYCGERWETFEICKARIDAWLKPEADVPTYPKLIPAICLGEENINRRNAVLDGLARHIRETYAIPVFQFCSMPLSLNPSLTADGLVCDAYGMQDLPFRKHLIKFVALNSTSRSRCARLRTRRNAQQVSEGILASATCVDVVSSVMSISQSSTPFLPSFSRSVPNTLTKYGRDRRAKFVTDLRHI